MNINVHRLGLAERRRTPGLVLAIVVTKMVRQAIRNWIRSMDDDGTYDFPEIDPGDMCGACAIVSWVSWRILARLGVRAHLIRGEFDDGDHCWLKIGRAIVDGTATQFDVEGDVYVTGRDPRYMAVIKDDDVELEFQECWKSQSPFRYQPELQRIEDKITQELGPRARRSRAH